MANFDVNTWYSITHDENNDQVLVGTVLYDKATTGSTFFQVTDSTALTQQWQIYPSNTGYYVLRSRACGPEGFLHASGYPDGGPFPGNTIPDMKNYTKQDDSMFWLITP
jgi:hypothetical protein